MKVFINEEQKERLKLQPFIYKAISSKRTSLGDNPAFPPYGDFGFEYDVVKNTYEKTNEIIDNCIKNGELESKDPDYLLSVLSKKVKDCKKLEKPIITQLQKLCENIVNSVFSVPSETVILKCRLVGKIKPKKSMRILPEGDDEENGYDFEDVDEINLTNKVILKRRFINSLIQGVSYWLSTDIDDWFDTVYDLDDKIWGLWYDIKHITDYLLFVKEEKISEKNPMQMSYVEVTLGKNGKKTIIDAQGVIFPYLLRETFRGFLELFSSHGLPEDNKKAMYIIRKADFVVAEPWDLRLGMGIVDMLHKSLTKKYKTGLLSVTNRIPFFFTELCCMETDEFNDVMKNILLGTKKGNAIASTIDSKISHDLEYQKFKDKIQQKNIDKSLISDGDFSKEELDNYVIQENEEDEITLYHGTPHDFEKFDLAYLSTGFGQQAHGYGVYLTTSENTAKAYSQGNFIYIVEVPDGKYLNNKKINKSEALNIAKKFFKYYTTEDEYGKEAYKGYENEFWQEECKYIADCENGESIYGTIASLIGSDKKTSAFLHSIGYVGLMIYCTNGETFEKFINYVIFDANDIEIKEKKTSSNSQISENLESEMMAYHGSGADFDKFNHKKYLNTGAGSQSFGWGTYVTNDKEVANGYSESLKRIQTEQFIDVFLNYLLEIKNMPDDLNTRKLAEEYKNELFRQYRITGGFEELKDICEDCLNNPEHYHMNEEKIELYKMFVFVLSNIYKENSFLYEVDIPEDNGTNYIEWYEQFPSEFMRRILQGFLKLHDRQLDSMAENNYPFRCDLYQDIQWMKQNPDRANKMIDIISNGDYEDFFSSSYYTNKSLTDGKSVYRRLQQIFFGRDKAASLFLMQCGFDGIKYPSGTKWQKPDGASEDAYNYVIFDANKVKIMNKTKV